jgi:hypothetical protein
MLISPLWNDWTIESNDFAERVVSKSNRATLQSGKSNFTSSSTCSVPNPWVESVPSLHWGQETESRDDVVVSLLEGCLKVVVG